MNGSISREDGDVWDADCETCQCKGGIVKCYKKPCPVISCKNPVKLDGECCHECLSELPYSPNLSITQSPLPLSETCFRNEIFYDHGIVLEQQCNNCKCNDGTFNCTSIECPKLDCSIDKQIKIADECCPYCKGM